MAAGSTCARPTSENSYTRRNNAMPSSRPSRRVRNRTNGSRPHRTLETRRTHSGRQLPDALPRMQSPQEQQMKLPHRGQARGCNNSVVQPDIQRGISTKNKSTLGGRRHIVKGIRILSMATTPLRLEGKRNAQPKIRMREKKTRGRRYRPTKASRLMLMPP